jgi:hypothetical protein
MALGSTQRLTEMSTKNLPGGKGLLARKADNLTAICEPRGLQRGVCKDILNRSKRNAGTAWTLNQLWSSHSTKIRSRIEALEYKKQAQSTGQNHINKL